VKENLDKPWNWEELSFNASLDFDFVKKHPEKIGNIFG